MAAASPTEICNMAIGALGGITKSSRLTSMSRSAASTNAQHACLDFYDESKREMLVYLDWSPARKVKALTVSDDDPLLDGRWTYKYARPDDCLIVRKIINDSDVEYEWESVSEEVGDGNETEFIYTDLEDALCRYTFECDESRYIPGMALLHSAILAERIAMTAVGDEKKAAAITMKLHSRIEQLAAALGAKEGYVETEAGEANVTGVF